MVRVLARSAFTELLQRVTKVARGLCCISNYLNYAGQCLVSGSQAGLCGAASFMQGGDIVRAPVTQAVHYGPWPASSDAGRQLQVNYCPSPVARSQERGNLIGWTNMSLSSFAVKAELWVCLATDRHLCTL